MLDNESWARLLEGLNRATVSGELEWQRVEANNPFGFGVTIGSLRDKRTLRAYAKSAMYTISSEGSGYAPYELTILEKRDSSFKEIGMVRSSTMVDASAIYRINEKLESLFRKADSLAEDPAAVVDRLLGDFS